MRRSIDRGLKESRFGLVVLSPSFFEKHWPQVELDGLGQREVTGRKVILPVWHNVSREDVVQFSPTLADRVAVDSVRGLDAVIDEVMRVVRGDRPRPQSILSYPHRIAVNYQGQLAVRLGNLVEINRWLGPDGPGGSGQLRVCTMSDLTDQTDYTSSIANTMMTIIPVDVAIRGRVAGPIRRSTNSTDFFLEMTEEEFTKFDTNREVRRSPLVG